PCFGSPMNECHMFAGLKNVWRTFALPGASRNNTTRTPMTTIVDVVETATARLLPGSPSNRDRREPESRFSPPSSRSAGSPSALPSGLDGGDTDVDLQVLVLQLGERAVRPQRGQCLVDARHQRVVLGEQQAVVLAGGRELRDHDRAGDLRRGDVLRRRRVRHKGGDL